jgi:hypothetical protein
MQQGGSWKEVSVTEKAVSRHRASASQDQKENTITIQQLTSTVLYNTYELWRCVFTVRKPTIPHFFT